MWCRRRAGRSRDGRRSTSPLPTMRRRRPTPVTHGGLSLAPNHVRVPSALGRRAARLWRRPLVGSGPRRIAAGAPDPGADAGMSSTSALLPAARPCSSPRRVMTSLRSTRRQVALHDSARISERTHLKAQLVEADALSWKPDGQFDAILLDAPCSATGTFRRHPEVLYRARPKMIARMPSSSARLLDRAAQWVKPGGSIVYSVCSLEPEEGEQVVRELPC